MKFYKKNILLLKYYVRSNIIRVSKILQISLSYLCCKVLFKYFKMILICIDCKIFFFFLFLEFNKWRFEHLTSWTKTCLNQLNYASLASSTNFHCFIFPFKCCWHKAYHTNINVQTFKLEGLETLFWSLKLR